MPVWTRIQRIDIILTFVFFNSSWSYQAPYIPSMLKGVLDFRWNLVESQLTNWFRCRLTLWFHLIHFSGPELFFHWTLAELNLVRVSRLCLGCVFGEVLSLLAFWTIYKLTFLFWTDSINNGETLDLLGLKSYQQRAFMAKDSHVSQISGNSCSLTLNTGFICFTVFAP